MYECKLTADRKEPAAGTLQSEAESHRWMACIGDYSGAPVAVTICDYKSCFLLVRRLLNLAESHLYLGSVQMNPIPESFPQAHERSRQAELIVSEIPVFTVKNQMLNIARIR